MRSRVQKRAFSAAAAASKSKEPPKKEIDKILIANRGEISCRVSRTAHKMGIKTVAIYSDPDANAVHVRAADEAICVGPAASSASYLNVPRILSAIERTGAQAVHPGYGFLSENAAFARVLEERGVSFIGPPSTAIEAMGDKIESKALAIKAGVHTIPGYMGTVPSAEEAVKIARDIGYPVMIKASAGGGGKGMRVAYNDAEVIEGYRLSKEEAKSSFGDDRLFVERFIQDPRHIEIQLIADGHGNVVALPERECSIQRRNQKVIEESPSVLLDPVTRRAMQEQACALARAVGYTSAGTVEFLADAQRRFYFLEMNTRLQVEHPVTEAVTGLDLVELMIRVAKGETLPKKLIEQYGAGGVPIIGHSFEARVYAEDPFRGFLPSTGRLSRYEEPQSFAHVDPFIRDASEVSAGTPADASSVGHQAVHGIRTDAGVSEGSEISMFYDPMICKLVTHGKDRGQALDRLRAALDSYVVRGVGHNISFLRDLTDHERFIRGTISTQFIREEYPHGFTGVRLTTESQQEMVAGAAVMHVLRSMTSYSVSGQLDLGKAVLPDLSTVVVSVGARKHGSSEVPPTWRCELEEVWEEGNGWKVAMQALDGKGVAQGAATTVTLQGVEWATEGTLMVAQLAGKKVTPGRPSEATMRLQHLSALPDGFKLRYKGALHDVYVRSERAHALAAHMLPKPVRDTSKQLTSPMPGKLVTVAVSAGQSVEIGQELCVMEAMKMQNVLRSARKGVVKAVRGKAGDTLAVDQVILEFE